MKNDEQMYRSLLSRYDAYQVKKQRQRRIIRRAVPIAACFCFTVVLGLGVWQHRANLPPVPVKQEPETTTAVTEITTNAIAEQPSTALTEQITQPVSTASSLQTTVPPITTTLQTQGLTTVVTSPVSVTITEQTKPVTQAQIYSENAEGVRFASVLLDDDHYVDISTKASEEEVCDFLKTFRFEQIQI